MRVERNGRGIQIEENGSRSGARRSNSVGESCGDEFRSFAGRQFDRYVYGSTSRNRTGYATCESGSAQFEIYGFACGYGDCGSGLSNVRSARERDGAVARQGGFSNGSYAFGRNVPGDVRKFRGIVQDSVRKRLEIEMRGRLSVRIDGRRFNDRQSGSGGYFESRRSAGFAHSVIGFEIDVRNFASSDDVSRVYGYGYGGSRGRGIDENRRVRAPCRRVARFVVRANSDVVPSVRKRNVRGEARRSSTL